MLGVVDWQGREGFPHGSTLSCLSKLYVSHHNLADVSTRMLLASRSWLDVKVSFATAETALMFNPKAKPSNEPCQSRFRPGPCAVQTPWDLLMGRKRGPRDDGADGRRGGRERQMERGSHAVEVKTELGPRTLGHPGKMSCPQDVNRARVEV